MGKIINVNHLSLSKKLLLQFKVFAHTDLNFSVYQFEEVFTYFKRVSKNTCNAYLLVV